MAENKNVPKFWQSATIGLTIWMIIAEYTKYHHKTKFDGDVF